MLHETIRTHALLAKSLYESHLRAEGRVVFPPSPSDSDVELLLQLINYPIHLPFYLL